MPQRSTTPNSLSFTPLRLLKSEVTQEGMVFEFIDDNGVRLKTPVIPYNPAIDPMRINNAEYNGDQIRIKNDTGQTIIDVFADSIEYESPIATSMNPNGQMFIDPEEGEDDLPLRTFSLSEAETTPIGFSNAFAEANRARQNVDSTIQRELDRRFPAQDSQVRASQIFDGTAEEAMREARARSVERQNFMREQSSRMGYPYTEDEIESQGASPSITIDFEMKCSCCEGKIHYPDKIVQLLGEEKTIKYFEFCKKTGTEPQLFCCSCYGLMQNNKNIISAVNKMNDKIKKMMDLTEREAEVDKREKELDEQLTKKKSFWKK